LVGNEVKVQLTRRETQVVRLLARGRTYVQVADELGMSANTVGTHVKNAYLKLDVHNAASAVVRAIQLGLIDV
jgi:LuxR family transcriptional regulator, maltose regulon positive regulatory protein